jgi:general stress protein YciG
MPNSNPQENSQNQPIDNKQQETASGRSDVKEAKDAHPTRAGAARGTAAMDPGTRQEVARKGGLAVSRNKQHMADIGRKGGQSVSKNREHMADIGRKGGAASRGSRGSVPEGSHPNESGSNSGNDSDTGSGI